MSPFSVPELREGCQDTLDTTRLEPWLKAHVSGYTGPVSVRQFAGGQSNPTYCLQSTGRRYVLRRKPSGKLLPSAHAIEREYRVVKALQGSCVPVATPYALCEDPDVIGSAFYVMDYVGGRIFWNASLPESALAERRAIYEEMVRVQAALHSVDYRAASLEDYGRSSGYIERQVSRWTQQYRASQTERVDAFENLIDWLPLHVPANSASALVHGDFRLDNTVFHPTEPRILAVLDWELSTVGHPLVDFAYLCMRHHLSVGEFQGLAGLDLDALNIPGEAQCIAEYCRLRAIEPVSEREWAYYMSFSMFRLAAILQGVLARARQGNAASASAGEAGARARPLAELAWAMIRTSFGA